VWRCGLTALMLSPRLVNFWRYPARDFVELLVTKISFFPCSSPKHTLR
jgi:hypothetical protein